MDSMQDVGAHDDVEPYGEERLSYDVVRAANPLANVGLLMIGTGAVLGAYLLGDAIAMAI